MSAVVAELLADHKQRRRDYRREASAVYAWQGAVLAEQLGYTDTILRWRYRGDDLVPWPFAASRTGERKVRSVALKYLEELWSRHVGRYAPWHPEVPKLTIGFRCCLSERPRLRRRRAAAHARTYSHAIYVPLDLLNRTTLLHEVAHLLVPRSNHGPGFCAALIDLWERELGIDRAHALEVGVRFGVEFAP